MERIPFAARSNGPLSASITVLEVEVFRPLADFGQFGTGHRQKFIIHNTLHKVHKFLKLFLFNKYIFQCRDNFFLGTYNYIFSLNGIYIENG